MVYAIIDNDGSIGDKGDVIAVCQREDIADEIVSRLIDYRGLISKGELYDDFEVRIL